MSCFIPPPPEPVLWLEIGKAIIGPFIGAGLAFAANAWNERRKRRRDNLAAANLALAILQRQADAFFNVRKGFLADRSARLAALGQNVPKWLHFKPMMYTFSRDLQFDFQPLTFLFEQRDTDVVAKLSVAEGRYFDLAAVVTELNSTTEDLQQKLVELGIGLQTQFDANIVATQLGPAIVGKVTSFADALVKRFDEDEKDYRDAAVSLRQALLRKYKPQEVLSIVPKPEYAKIDWAQA